MKVGRMAERLGRGLQNLVQRFESASDLVLFLKVIYKSKKMAVTRLKRKDRRNKNTAKKEVQFLKMGSNVEIGSRSKMPKNSQIIKNNEILDELLEAAK